MTVSLLQTLKARFSGTMRAKRASPIMAVSLTALTALAGAAVLYAASAFFPAGDTPPTVKSEWRPPRLSAFEPTASKPPTSDEQTLSRPLFVKSRRPTSANATAAPTDPASEPIAPSPAFSLAGIVHFGANSRAFLAKSDGADGEWYEVGEKVAGWTLAQIRRVDLTLTSGERSANLKLYLDSPAAEAAATAPPAPPPPPFYRDPKFRKRG